MQRDEMIKRHEGFRPYLYKCPAQKSTIGWGHNVDANPLPGYMQEYLREHDMLTEPMLDTLYAKDVHFAEEAARDVVGREHWDNLDEVRRDVLVDMAFNLGKVGLSRFERLLAAIRRGDWEAAKNNMKASLWHKQVGARARELEAMMLTGEYQTA